VSELKITVDQLKNYLGTGLRIVGTANKNGFKVDIILGPNHLDVENNKLTYSLLPVVYRLSDLDKEIEINGEKFIPKEWLENQCITLFHPITTSNFISRPYWVAQKLFEWHFWPFGEEYFERALVIDKRKEVTNG